MNWNQASFTSNTGKHISSVVNSQSTISSVSSNCTKLNGLVIIPYGILSKVMYFCSEDMQRIVKFFIRQTNAVSACPSYFSRSLVFVFAGVKPCHVFYVYGY